MSSVMKIEPKEPVTMAPMIGPQMATGYGNHGANTTKNSMLGWLAGGGSAEDDIDLHAAALRKRARDLDAGGGLARSATRTLTTSVVGPGLVPKPTIDLELLGMSEEEGEAWAKAARREFDLWAKKKTCDASHQANFFQLQHLAFLSMLMSGDVFVMFPMVESPGSPFLTHIRLLEADRVSTPNSYGESTADTAKNGNRIVDGVETDKTGRVVAFHIASAHPLSSGAGSITWERIEAYGKESGMPNIIQMMHMERPEQRRGVPLVAAMMAQLKQLGRYTDSELAACIVASMFTVFIKQTNSNPGVFNGQEQIAPEARVTDDPRKLELAPGAVYKLEPGEEAQTINPSRNNTTFDKFVDAVYTQIGAGLEMPRDILIKRHDKSYSASRAALLEFWEMVMPRRGWFISDFCHPAYEAFLSEAVAIGRIEAPGFFDDPVIRQAWCKAEWIGTSMGQLDPLKEIKAAALKVQSNFSTQEREALEITGADYNDIIRQRKIEAAIDAELKRINPASTKADTDDEPDEKDEPDEDEKEEEEE